MAIRGHVDGVEGSYLTGWAAAEPDTGNCAITITDEAGNLLARGRASRHRPDLASLGLGRTSLAFRIAVPQSAERRMLHVLADGEELTGSPVLTGPGMFSGHATVEGDLVTGWVMERTANPAPPLITVVNHAGVEVARGRGRVDEHPADPLFAPARFALRLDASCFGAGEMRLRVLANGVPFHVTGCNLTLAGNLDRLTPGHCSGWLLSPEAPRRAFEIELYRNGKPVETVPCEQERGDVRAVYPEAVTPGFDITLDAADFPPNEAASISLRLKGSDKDLFEGPYEVASRPAAVTAVYHAARLANLGLPGITPPMRAVLNQALKDYLAKVRAEDGFTLSRQPDALLPQPARPRLVIIIPIYRGVEVTRACIESVLAHRNAETDLLVLINDFSPDAPMRPMLEPYGRMQNVTLLHNDENLGFVRTVNRGMGWAQGADVVLLNSDTVTFAGGLDELIRVAYARPEIGTVTAMSNNATIFSYPNAALRQGRLDDINWKELAALALEHNAGLVEDVPTGHGFCMFIKGEVIRRIGFLDEGFGRGYGEENDFCARAAALGYRSVAAAGVLVEHKESISFENEKASLLAQNLPKLNAMYPEYTPVIMDFERRDGMRRLRWALDRARLARAREAGAEFVLVVSNALEGGTPKAISDIEKGAGFGWARKLSLSVTEGGLLSLTAENPLLSASFSKDEAADLLEVLDSAAPATVLVHQLLGFPAPFLELFGGWLKGRHSVFWAHDFYALCPRVTMIDAIGRFCGGADADTCGRCVEMGGAHETSVLTDLTPAAHRDLFARMFSNFTHVLAPSGNTVSYLSRIFPDVKFEAVPHPEPVEGATGPRAGTDEEIVLLGAIGPHKGSGTLLEIARRARLTHPHLHFRIIGYTNIDKQLQAVGNVTITGKYLPDELPGLLAETKGRLALFLPAWPETFSYTLSELVRRGFIPLVPDIGAPAERVRAAEYGVVFPFPADAETVLKTIDDIASGAVRAVGEGAVPARFFTGIEGFDRVRQIIRPGQAVVAEAPGPEDPPARPPAKARARRNRAETEPAA